MRDRNFVVLLVVLSLAVKIPISLFLVHGFGVDESLYLSTARDYIQTGIFGVHTDQNDFRFIAPLLAFVMSGFERLFGSAGPLLVSPVFGSLAIIPFFYLGKLALGHNAGRLTAIFVLLNPAYFLLNTRPLTETLALFLFSAAALLFISALKERKWWILVLPMTLLTFVTRYPYGLILVVFYLAMLAFERKPRMFFNKEFAIGLVVALVVATPWLLYNYQSFGNILGGPLHQGGSDVGFDIQGGSYYITYLIEVIGLAFPFVLYSLIKDRRDRKMLPFIIGLAVVFLVQFLVFSRIPEERYILPVLPFASVLFASGYGHMLKWKGKIVTYVLIALMVLNAAAAIYLTNQFDNLPKYVDSNDAALWMKQNCGPVLMGNIHTPVYYFTGSDPIQPAFDAAIDRDIIMSRNVSCVVVSLTEAPYKNFFTNISSSFSSTNETFGGAIVYKISK